MIFMEKGNHQQAKIIKNLPANDVSAIYEFSNRIKSTLGEALQEIRLFGSKTKGTSNLESDIDILIITKRINNEQKDLIYEVATDINLYYDVLIIPIISESRLYYSPNFQSSYFYKETQEEGIVI